MFYKGEIAKIIDAFMREQGGLLRYEDLANHRSEWVMPVSTNYRGWDVYELPPNGQGIAALQILNVLEGYDIAAMGFGSADYIHTLVEAKKLAFADRARYYADPDFAAAPVAGLISKEYAAAQRARIQPDRAARAVDGVAIGRRASATEGALSSDERVMPDLDALDQELDRRLAASKGTDSAAPAEAAQLLEGLSNLPGVTDLVLLEEKALDKRGFRATLSRELDVQLGRDAAAEDEMLRLVEQSSS